MQMKRKGGEGGIILLKRKVPDIIRITQDTRESIAQLEINASISDNGNIRESRITTKKVLAKYKALSKPNAIGRHARASQCSKANTMEILIGCPCYLI